jgi:hypothetical protein
MAPTDEEPLPEVVTADDEVVGAVSGTLWQDGSGFAIVAVEQGGTEVAIPMRLGQFGLPGNQVRVDFSAGEVRSAPTVGDLMAGGGAEAVRLVAEHFDLGLTGPPPGPLTNKLPPWWGTPEPTPTDPGEPKPEHGEKK